MADRRSLLSRFWPASASRRTTSTQTITPPPAKPASPPPSTPNRGPTTTTQLADFASTPTPDHHPITTTQPTKDHQTDEQSSNTISEPRKSPSTQSKTLITSTKPTDEHKTSSPSRALSPTKPSSPNRRVTKSQSPSQSSSPSNSTPQAQGTGSQTPKIASTPRLKSPSAKAGSSSSRKRTQPKSPLKESRQHTQEISSTEDDPKPVTSQQEPQVNAVVEIDRANDFNGKNLDETSFKHDEMVPTPSQSSENGTTTTSDPRPKAPTLSKSLDMPTTNSEHEPLESKPGEAEDVKEVVQGTKNEANEEMKKEKSFSKDQIIEKTEIPSKPLSFSSEDHVIEKKTITSKPDKVKREEQESLHTNETLRVAPDKMTNGEPKGAISDKHVSVITLAGENRGALMQLESNSSKGEGTIHIHRSYKMNPNESVEATTNVEECSDQKKPEDANSDDDQPTETYVNNNSQGINNSIVFHSSITEGSPGVHMVVNHLLKELIQSTNKTHLPETRKIDFNTTRTEKLTYQPTIRRRCLKGLFLETSDSDPEKPRRHGCRVSCEKRDKEDDTDIS